MSGTAKGYSRAQIALHWLIAVLIILQFVFHEGIVQAVDALQDGAAVPADLVTSVNLHVWFGILVLLLAVVRIGLRLTTGAPPAAAGTPVLQARLASLVHWALYALLFFAPLSGMMAWFVNLDASDLHTIVKPMFIVLVALHVVGAIYHAALKRDGTLRRMVVPNP